MKIATWNVNGIRARATQLCDWLERDRPDIVCLQELKARPDQVPEPCKLLDYHVYWHGAGAYSGVSLHVRRGVFGQRDEERTLFDGMLDGRMVDVARALHPEDERMFSWWPPWRNMRQRNIGWRIDYILASRSFAERAQSCVVLADIGTSDHAP